MNTIPLINAMLSYGLGCFLAVRWMSGRFREAALVVVNVLFFWFILRAATALNWFFTLDDFAIFEALLVYALIGRMVMRRLTGMVREAALAVMSTMGVLVLFLNGNFFALGPYLELIGVFYLAMWWFSDRSRGWAWVAFFIPLLALVFVRYGVADVPAGLAKMAGWRGQQELNALTHLTGISYLVFRCSRLVLEVRNGLVRKPNFLEYLNFAFFLPTMQVGPINTYTNFRRGFEGVYEVPAGQALLRMQVGAVKYFLLCVICNQLTYSGLLRDGFSHPWTDLPVAMLFYYFYLYLNFSGMCDMAIGAGGLMGIAVPENFDNPLAARNVKEFWSRWHITLSTWMRDLVFSPLSKYLVAQFGGGRANHAVALAIVVVFLLVGIWHGVGWNFAVFGAVQALGVAANHYYTIWLKRKLGRDGFKAYNENRWIHAAAVAVTFCFYGSSLFFFANTFPQIADIFSCLK
jgi:D-alanyl-lipoteichoic acid acyltransferase DltB (MBOAT superfamily)